MDFPVPGDFSDQRSKSVCANIGRFFCTRPNLFSLRAARAKLQGSTVWRLAELWDFPAEFTYRPLLCMPFCLHHLRAIHTYTHTDSGSDILTEEKPAHRVGTWSWSRLAGLRRSVPAWADDGEFPPR